MPTAGTEIEILQIITVLVVAIAMALPLAHALELPGKLRLDREQYLAVQPIYYPGFTLAGMCEPLGLLLLLVLVILTPSGNAGVWLVIGAFLALLAMHAAYWVLTHPVNNFWLEGFKLKGLGGRFFAFGARRPASTGKPEWIYLRDRWEMSHVIRAVLGAVSLLLLVAATAAFD